MSLDPKLSGGQSLKEEVERGSSIPGVVTVTNKNSYPIIPLREMVLFPGTMIPLLLGRPGTITAMLRTLESKDRLAFFTLQKNSGDDEVSAGELHSTGVIGKITESSQSPQQLSRILVEALSPAVMVKAKKNSGYLSTTLEPLKVSKGRGYKSLVNTAVTKFSNYLSHNPDIPQEIMNKLDEISNSEKKLYIIASQLNIPCTLKQEVLKVNSLSHKAELIIEYINNEIDIGILNRRLEHEVRTSISQTQKEYYLNEQLKKIQNELGEKAPRLTPDLQRLEQEVKDRQLPEHANTKVQEEIRRLDFLHSSSPEYSVVRNYIEWSLSLPWQIVTRDTSSFARIKKQLDTDHFGLKEIKDRIIEHIAVYKLAGRDRSPVLCFTGPPGVGKTSLGNSIARALNRKFVRISLGGLRDEAEIRGHRRTYIGSMPGKIVQALKKSGAMNPVVLLDEIDKMGIDFRGDPASALLEVLDPEQNQEFMDHFMEIGIDLSRIFFIVTANVASSIPDSLRDRMEVIKISGYHLHEKLEIAKKHLIPKVRSLCGLKSGHLQLSDKVIENIINMYTHEAGVRNLEKSISKIARKIARSIVQSRKTPKNINAKSLPGYLGVPIKNEGTLPVEYPPGIVTGLAWTPAGGEILAVECSLLSGKGQLKLTGQMGEVMQESAQLALTIIRGNLKKFGIDPRIVKQTDIHVHTPEGAIPKDGPSAGTAITVAIFSAFLQQSVSPQIAFSGEISLSGKIHPVGGLPEKVLAALQSGVKRIMVPAENRHDIAKLPPYAKKQLKIEFKKDIGTVLRQLFEKKKSLVSGK